MEFVTEVQPLKGLLTPMTTCNRVLQDNWHLERNRAILPREPFSDGGLLPRSPTHLSHKEVHQPFIVGHGEEVGIVVGWIGIIDLSSTLRFGFKPSFIVCSFVCDNSEVGLLKHKGT